LETLFGDNVVQPTIIPRTCQVVFENPRQNALRRDKLARRRPLDEFITMYNNAA
jgi:hypothetical protein